MATYSHAWRAMNSSVPGAVSPPLIEAAATRMPTITTTIAQNSVVLNACFVSVEIRRVTPYLAERSTPAPGARLVADSMLIPSSWIWVCSKLGQAPFGRDAILVVTTGPNVFPLVIDVGDPTGAKPEVPAYLRENQISRCCDRSSSARSGTRTRKPPEGQRLLRPPRLPVSPSGPGDGSPSVVGVSAVVAGNRGQAIGSRHG